jgi:hypothetical protein
MVFQFFYSQRVSFVNAKCVDVYIRDIRDCYVTVALGNCYTTSPLDNCYITVTLGIFYHKQHGETQRGKHK